MSRTSTTGERYLPVPGDVIALKDAGRTFYKSDPTEDPIAFFGSFTLGEGQALLVVESHEWSVHVEDSKELVLRLVELGKDPPREIFY